VTALIFAEEKFMWAMCDINLSEGAYLIAVRPDPHNHSHLF